MCPSTCQNDPLTCQTDAPRCQKVGWKGRIVKCNIVNVPVDMPKRRTRARRHAKTMQVWCPSTCQNVACACRHAKSDATVLVDMPKGRAAMAIFYIAFFSLLRGDFLTCRRMVSYCVSSCNVAGAGDEGQLLCATVAAALILSCDWFLFGVLQCAVADSRGMAAFWLPCCVAICVARCVFATSRCRSQNAMATSRFIAAGAGCVCSSIVICGY